MRTIGLAFLIALTGAMSPGPFLAAVIGQVLAQGLGAVVGLLAGHACLEALLIAGLAGGLSRYLAANRVRGILSLIGGAVLVWMGNGVIRQAGAAVLRGDQSTAKSGLLLFLWGVGASVSNPYFTGWWATVGTGQMAALGLRSRSDYLGFFVGHELGDIAWYVLVAVTLVAGRGWLSEGLYRDLLWVCGGVVVLLGGLFLFLGTRFLVVVRAGSVTRDSPGGRTP